MISLRSGCGYPKAGTAIPRNATGLPAEGHGLEMQREMKWKCRNCSPYLSVEIPSSPDIRDPACQGLEDGIKGVAWAEAC